MIFHENRLLADDSHKQTILMKYHTLFLSKIGKDVAKFVVCCSRDWRFKGFLFRVLIETIVVLSTHNICFCWEKENNF